MCSTDVVHQDKTKNVSEIIVVEFYVLNALTFEHITYCTGKKKKKKKKALFAVCSIVRKIKIFLEARVTCGITVSMSAFLACHQF